MVGLARGVIVPVVIAAAGAVEVLVRPWETVAFDGLYTSGCPLKERNVSEESSKHFRDPAAFLFGASGELAVGVLIGDVNRRRTDRAWRRVGLLGLPRTFAVGTRVLRGGSRVARFGGVYVGPHSFLKEGRNVHRHAGRREAGAAECYTELVLPDGRSPWADGLK